LFFSAGIIHTLCKKFCNLSCT